MDPATIRSEKEALRARMRTARRERPADWFGEASARIAERVRAMPEVRGARRAALYLALPREVQTADLIRALVAAGTDVCVPAWDPGRAGYRLADYAPGAAVAAGQAGAREPHGPRWVDAATVDAWVVPALAYDPGGGRIGYGGGAFDQLLHGRRGVAIGVAFSFQLTTRVPREPHDEAVDFVVTERDMVDCRRAPRI